MPNFIQDSATPQSLVVGQSGPQEATRRSPARTNETEGAVAHYQCLIVSVSTERREMLLRAAAEGGWQTLVASTADSARKQMARLFIQLAIVDLEHAPLEDTEEFREVLEDLAGMTGLLLVVCGNEGEPLEEVWARQLGVWLYLPGVSSGEDITMLCGEAKQITEQLHAAQMHAARQFHGAHATVSNTHDSAN